MIVTTQVLTAVSRDFGLPSHLDPISGQEVGAPNKAPTLER